MKKSIRYVRRNGELANRHSWYKMFIRLLHVSKLRTKENQKRKKHNI